MSRNNWYKWEARYDPLLVVRREFVRDGRIYVTGCCAWNQVPARVPIVDLSSAPLCAHVVSQTIPALASGGPGDDTPLKGVR